MTRSYLAQRLHGIYAIVNEGRSDPVELTRAVLAGGAGIVQYRAKSGIVPQHAQAIRELTAAAGALFVLNDVWKAADAYDADGVHLGPDDARVDELAAIRAALPDRLIGVSCGTIDEARDANRFDLDYIGVGSVYATQSKHDAGEPIGLDGLRAIAAQSVVPVAAIGGISRSNVGEVALTGAAMAAVISAIAASADPKAATAELLELWKARA
ncbi:MAG: thiamine phosphate synthase [Candidatus Eremiobacteraeota bacterium]|nr:thiamine phosphate synthase [Candidatus Eremiobacteraeota bacterium]